MKRLKITVDDLKKSKRFNQVKDLVFEILIYPIFKDNIDNKINLKNTDVDIRDVLFKKYDNLRESELPKYISYYLHIEILKQNIPEDQANLLYQKYGKLQVKPYITTKMIDSEYSVEQRKKILFQWLSQYQIPCIEHQGLIYHLNLLLKTQATEEVKIILSKI